MADIDEIPVPVEDGQGKKGTRTIAKEMEGRRNRAAGLKKGGGTGSGESVGLVFLATVFGVEDNPYLNNIGLPVVIGGVVMTACAVLSCVAMGTGM